MTSDSHPTSKNLTQLLELVDEHARDWMKVGQSGSGYVYDPSAPYDKKAALETTTSLKQEIERLTRELEKAQTALASAYQAAGVFVMPEHDKRPADRDQTELLDLLSRWETMTKEQIEAFLPWPKEWVQQPRDLAKAKQCAYDAFREWNDVTGFVPRGISYEAEIESLLDDAVNFGWNARNGEPNSAPETSGGWRPIETVPRDVKVLTLRWSMGDKRPLIDTATLERHGQATGLHHGNGVFFCKVTHWMPLPEPPLKASGEST